LYHHQLKGALGLHEAGWNVDSFSVGGGDMVKFVGEGGVAGEDPDAEMDCASALCVIEVLKWKAM
jgi:hypothetical protein